jgi:hypothetical protein
MIEGLRAEAFTASSQTGREYGQLFFNILRIANHIDDRADNTGEPP